MRFSYESNGLFFLSYPLKIEIPRKKKTFAKPVSCSSHTRKVSETGLNYVVLKPCDRGLKSHLLTTS